MTFIGLNLTALPVQSSSGNRKTTSNRMNTASNQLKGISNGLHPASNEPELTSGQVKASFVFPQRGKAGVSGALELLINKGSEMMSNFILCFYPDSPRASALALPLSRERGAERPQGGRRGEYAKKYDDE